MVEKSKRTERKKAATRQRIIETAAKNFAERGIGEVSLEEIAGEADFARGTIYSHFTSKEVLVYEILYPVLQFSVKETHNLFELEPTEAFEGIIMLYLRLWQDYHHSLRLIYRLKPVELGRLEEIHTEFLHNMYKVFTRITEAGLIRISDPKLAALVTYRIAVPILELFDGRPELESMYKSMMKGALLS